MLYFFSHGRFALQKGKVKMNKFINFVEVILNIANILISILGLIIHYARMK